MYSQLREVQLVVAALKASGIHDVVMASGGSDIPIIHSIENDVFFKCYSVVDERSLVYFAMGLAQERCAPVACVCTSGTAVANFLPGIVESSFQDVPLVAITADKNPRYLDQLETQKIDQRGIFGHWVRKAVDLPMIQSEADFRHARRLLQDALYELDHHQPGPVHINVPIVGNDAVYDVDVLPQVQPYLREDACSFLRRGWESYARELRGKRILLLVGQGIMFNDEDLAALRAFVMAHDCAVGVEHLSNLPFDLAFNAYKVTEVQASAMDRSLVPDIVLSLGNNYAGGAIKTFLRKHSDHFEHWAVTPGGMPRNTYDSLSVVFECDSRFFFERLPFERRQVDAPYRNMWTEKACAISLERVTFSSAYVGRAVNRTIPDGSILHLAILNSVRVSQLFDLSPRVRTYANVGALGIDGCLSTFVGQAAADPNRLAYLLIGDLSFFYDMNAASLRDVGPNIRIIILNNGGGSEFHYYMGERRIPTINRYVCAENDRTARGWLESLGYYYSSAYSEEDVDAALLHMAERSDRPMVLEVFTDMKADAEALHNAYFSATKRDVKATAKHIMKRFLSPKQINALKRWVR